MKFRFQKFIKEKNTVIPPTDPERVNRSGWEQAFKEMAKNGDDQLVMPDVFNDGDIIDWAW